MAEYKEIKTRIALKQNTYEYWTEGAGKDYVPLYGEVCFCAIEEKTQGAQTAPTVLFKIGDGTHKMMGENQLKWVSALAADVFDWAKKSETEFIAWATGLKYITVGETTYTIKEYVDLMVGELDTRIGKLADLNTNITNKTSIVGAINAVRTEALNAVNAGGSGSVITVRKDNNNKYTVLQGGSEVAESIEIADATFDVKVGGGLAGDDVQFSANAIENKEITISHAAKADGLVDGTEADRTYIKKLTFDDYGHVTGYVTGTEVDQDLTHDHDAQYKKLQTAYTKELTGAQVVAKVEQNANGNITVTERTLTAADLGLDTVMHFIGAYAAAPTKAFVDTGDERALDNGDVYLNTANNTEYVYSGNKWHELGNEGEAGSHAYKTTSITGIGYLTGGGTLEANRTIDISDEVKAKIDKVWQEVGDYKTKQTAVDNKITKAAHVLTTLTQNANGEIAYEVKELAPADIGAQPAGNYKTKQEEKAFAGSTVKTVTNVTQNANGEVEVTYEEIAFPEFPELPGAAGQAVIASVANDVVTLKTGATLGDVNGTHTLANTEGENIVLAKVAKTGSAYDLNEVNAGKDKDGEDILYFVLDCNW